MIITLFLIRTQNRGSHACVRHKLTTFIGHKLGALDQVLKSMFPKHGKDYDGEILKIYSTKIATEEEKHSSLCI